MVQRRPSDYKGSRGWQDRVALQTALGACLGVVGGTAIAIVRGRQLGPYAGAITFNSAVTSACLTGAQEAVRELRFAPPDDLLNGLLGGFSVGALAGRYNGGPTAAWPAGLLMALVGASLQWGSVELREFRLRQVEAQLHMSEGEIGANLAVADSKGHGGWSTGETVGETGEVSSVRHYSSTPEPDGRMIDVTVEGENILKEKTKFKDNEATENVAKCPVNRTAWDWPEWMPIRPAKPAKHMSKDVIKSNELTPEK